MADQKMNKKAPYDYYLILATAVVLFIISLVCIYAMFYFKMAQIHQTSTDIKVQYMDGINTAVSPFVALLILLIGICVPKRLLSTSWLNRVAGLLLLIVAAVSFFYDIKTGLLVLLLISLALQAVILVLAIKGSSSLNFEKKGYWIRIGSSLIHMGLILFILDLFLYRNLKLHLILFWITTITWIAGMSFSFFSEGILRTKNLLTAKIFLRSRPNNNDD